MEKLLVLLLLNLSLCIPPQIYSQNLVLNPSFEKSKSLIAKRSLERPIHSAKYWLNPNAGQPKIYGSKKDGFVFDKEGTSWNFRAKSGKNVASLFVYGVHPLQGYPRRDYIQGSLSQPLEVGKKYYFSFWVHYHCEGSDKIGIAFLPTWDFQLRSGILKLKPDAYQKEVSNYGWDASWAIVQDSFIAEHAYKTFIIGNFFTDAETAVQSDNIGHHLAYIDDISVHEAINPHMPGMEIPPELPKAPKLDSEPVAPPVESKPPVRETPTLPPASVKSPENPQPKILPRPSTVKTYIPTPVRPEPKLPPKPEGFSPTPIFFLYDSPIVRQQYKNTLKPLLAHLRQHPQLNILIKAYASEEGGTMYNFSLAMDRAEQTKRFLRAKGIGPDRILIKVIGELVNAEDLAQGKVYNRRVDFEILDK